MEDKPVYPALGLALPDKHPGENPVFINARALQQFLNDLPLADTSGSTALMLEQLNQLNRLDLDLSLRQSHLTTLEPILHQLYQSLRKGLSPAKFPLRSHSLQKALLCADLLTSQALAYKRLIADNLDDLPSAKPDSALADNIFNCMKTLYDYIQVRALCYQPLAERTWLEIHQLFLLASRNKLERMTLSVDNNMTIKRLYKQLMLFALANPIQLGQSEILDLIALLPEVDAFVKLSIIETAEQKTDFGFYINLNQDQTAVHISSLVSDNNKRVLLLQTDKLLKLLINILQAHQAQTHALSGKASPHLHETLLRNLGYASHRRIKRIRHNEQLQVIAGLKNISQWLQSADHPATKETLPDDHDELTVLTMGVEESTALNRGTLIIDKQSQADKPIEAYSLFDGSQPLENDNSGLCESLNYSTVGHRLFWSSDMLPQINVGELIGIAEPGTQYQCSLHMVRWLMQDNESLHVGTEMLAERVTSNTFKINESARMQSPRTVFTALIIPETQERALQIITHSSQFTQYDQLFLAPGTGHTQQAKLGKLIESSELYDRFRLRLK